MVTPLGWVWKLILAVSMAAASAVYRLDQAGIARAEVMDSGVKMRSQGQRIRERTQAFMLCQWFPFPIGKRTEKQNHRTGLGRSGGEIRLFWERERSGLRRGSG